MYSDGYGSAMAIGDFNGDCLIPGTGTDVR
jgi:hypothetical protein